MKDNNETGLMEGGNEWVAPPYHTTHHWLSQREGCRVLIYRLWRPLVVILEIDQARGMLYIARRRPTVTQISLLSIANQKFSYG